MGFLGQLAKGFVRSAVNQVGRDAGKVASNRIYGDAHSTPYRHVGDKLYADDDNAYYNPSDTIRKASKMGCWGWFGYFTLMVGFAHYFAGNLFAGRYVMPILLPIIFVVIGFFKGNRDYVYEVRKINIPTYHRDRRYKSGMRYEGDAAQEEYRKVPARESDRKMIKNYGRTFYLMALGVILIGLMFYFDGKPEDFADFVKK